MTEKEMAAAYPAMCQRCDDLQSDLEATQDCVERLKDDLNRANQEIANREAVICRLKAKLYDLTSGNWL